MVKILGGRRTGGLALSGARESIVIDRRLNSRSPMLNIAGGSALGAHLGDDSSLGPPVQGHR
jgi:hypothetical protein